MTSVKIVLYVEFSLAAVTDPQWHKFEAWKETLIQSSSSFPYLGWTVHGSLSGSPQMHRPACDECDLIHYLETN
jgi:hypothetical protein